MKLIITGNRKIWNSYLVNQIIDYYPDGLITEVITGGASGVESFAAIWAKRREIPFQIFLPDWYRYGASAGIISGRDMAKVGDALLAIVEGNTHEINYIIKQAQKLEKPCRVVNIHDHDKRPVCGLCSGSGCEECGYSGLASQCLFCGHALQIVRPGKYQCSNCD